MKRLIILFAFALGAAEQDAFVAGMKTLGTTMGPLVKSIQAGQMADVATGSKKVEEVFAVSQKFWAGKNVADATKWSEEAGALAKELGAAATANDAAAVKATIGKLAATCKACHDVHREKLADGTYKIK